jgi:fructose-1,6-bisphosphatase I
MLAPLDGASGIDDNMPVGTTFSVLPAVFESEQVGGSSLLQPGSRLLAAGYIISGSRTVLALTVGMGTQLYILDRRTATFQLIDAMVEISVRAATLTVNAADGRHWDGHTRRYVDDWLALRGETDETGLRTVPSASLAADCHRVLQRGGVQIYPTEARQRGAIERPNLIYEASPIAWLVEQAGGAASSGTERVLDIAPSTLQQRTQLIIGAREEVARFERYHAEGITDARLPLFIRRSLFLS